MLTMDIDLLYRCTHYITTENMLLVQVMSAAALISIVNLSPACAAVCPSKKMILCSCPSGRTDRRRQCLNIVMAGGGLR
jgi:hypothetical protein